MFKIAVLGSRDTVMGFKALGLDIYPVAEGTDITDLRRTFKKLTQAESNYAIIYVEEEVSVQISAEIEKFKDNPTPAVILIPGRSGSMGLGQSALSAAVERAVGSAI